MKSIKRAVTALCFGALAALPLVASAAEAPSLGKVGPPWLYGVQAYIYSFPLIMMDLTKDASTAVPTAGEITPPSTSSPS